MITQPFILQFANPVLPDVTQPPTAGTSCNTKGATGGDGKVESDDATDSDHHSIVEWEI